jgi:hypothetical protein
LHSKRNHPLFAGHDGGDDELDEQSAAGDVDADIDVDDEYGPPDEYGLSYPMEWLRAKCGFPSCIIFSLPS